MDNDFLKKLADDLCKIHKFLADNDQCRGIELYEKFEKEGGNVRLFLGVVDLCDDITSRWNRVNW